MTFNNDIFIFIYVAITHLYNILHAGCGMTNYYFKLRDIQDINNQWTDPVQRADSMEKGYEAFVRNWKQARGKIQLYKCKYTCN